MTAWRIQPSGVVTVLTAVNPYAEDLGVALNGLSGAMESAVTATQSPAISEAVQQYFQQVEGPRIQAMSTRIQASVNAVVAATEAYVSGDLEMAATHQQAGVDAVYPPQLPLGPGLVAY